jgi:valyl-tRNA synthetase
MMRLDGRPAELEKINEKDLVLFDRWILSRLEQTIKATDKNIAEFRLASAAKTVYNFVWGDYCSWYLELIKPDQPDQQIRQTSLDVATYVLNQILRLLHPFVPFVTEEIYHQLAGDDNGTLMKGPWAEAAGSHIDEDLEESLRQIQEIVTSVRSIRSELNVPPSKKSDLYIRVQDETLADLLKSHIVYFRSLAKVDNLHCGTNVKKPSLSASAVISGAEIYLPLADLIDIEEEKARLQKNLDGLKLQLEKVSKKLANSDFLANAPADVIDRERQKKEDFQERIHKLNKNLEQIVGW